MTESIWFSGPVKDAVSLVAQRNCVFLVYIYDESEKTNTLNATLQNEQVTKAIKEHTVALSMEKSSENATFFGQYYPIQNVPILYFLKQGTIREFGTESTSSQEIVDKINQANAVSAFEPIVPLPQQITQQQQPTNGVLEEEQPQEISEPILAASHPPAAIATKEASSSSSTKEEIQAKKAELQKQLDQVRKDRAEREKKLSQEQEIKRREEAKLMQDAQQDRKDKETKIYFEKLRQEKIKDEEHKRKVRQQIATDRAEKMAQRNAEKERKSTQQQQFVESSSLSASSSSGNANHEYSNLNIRQLDGTNIRNKFQASSTLSNVREWIKENRTDDSKKPYKLSSQFPTRQFTDSDNDTTLSNLNLCPSATIIMKPIKSMTTVSSSNQQGGLVQYAVGGFDFIYGILIAILNILTGFFTTLFPTAAAPHEVLSQQQQQPFFRNLRGGQRLGGGEASSSARDETNATQKRNPYATRVNTLHDDEEDEEDENEKRRSTYNGNSVNHE